MTDKLTDTLQELCQRENVSVDLLQKLLEIEKDYQNKERRFGIFDKIKSEIQEELDAQNHVTS